MRRALISLREWHNTISCLTVVGSDPENGIQTIPALVQQWPVTQAGLGRHKQRFAGGDRLSLWTVYCVDESSGAAGTVLSLDRHQVEEDANPLWGRAEAQEEPRITKTPWSQVTGQP